MTLFLQIVLYQWFGCIYMNIKQIKYDRLISRFLNCFNVFKHNNGLVLITRLPLSYYWIIYDTVNLLIDFLGLLMNRIWKMALYHQSLYCLFLLFHHISYFKFMMRLFKFIIDFNSDNGVKSLILLSLKNYYLFNLIL